LRLNRLVVPASSYRPNHDLRKPNIVNVGYHSTNYYAISVNDGWLLVDCGWPQTMPQFNAELKRKGIYPSNIHYILATHFHPDHAGLVEEFKKLGAKLILMESQEAALTRPASPGTSQTPALITTSRAGNLPLKFAKSRAFLASLGLSGEILPTPGHTDDSVTLILDEGYAFTGDLPARLLVPDENKAALASWAEIDHHQVTRIFPAHGG
jgi:endoribonuclease LACTB2